jgi:hypothetical protein
MSRRKRSIYDKTWKFKKMKKKMNIYHRFFSQSINLDLNIKVKHFLIQTCRFHQRLIFFTDIYYNSSTSAENEEVVHYFRN